MSSNSDSKNLKRAAGLFSAWWQVWLAAIVLFLIAWLAAGYKVYEGNQTIQLPLVQKLQDPSLYPQDPFVATLKGYSALLWWAVAALNRFLPLQPLLFVSFLLEKILLLVAAASLARAVRPGSRLAPWCGALVVALGIPALIGSLGKVTSHYFEQTAFSVPFFLWSFAAIVRGERWKWPIFCAIGATLNPMYGAYAVTYSILGILFVHRRHFLRWLSPIVLFFILALPAFIFALRSNASQTSDTHLWLMAVMVRFAHHLAPLQWDIMRYINFILFAAVLFVLAYSHVSDKERAGNRFVQAATYISIGWLAIAFLAAYGVKIPVLLVLHPARATDLWYAVSAIFLVAYFASRLEVGGSFQRAPNLMLLFIAVFLFSAFDFRYTPLALAFIVVLALHPKISAFLSIHADPRRAAIGLLIAGACLAILRPGLKERAYDYGASSGEREVAAWAKMNTPINAIFAIPPRRLDFFRPLAERSVLGTWKDGAAILWDKGFVSEWVARMQALGISVLPPENQRLSGRNSEFPNGWSDKEIIALCRKFGAQYSVLPTSHPTQLPAIFQGELGYKIVKIPAIAPEQFDFIAKIGI